MNYEAKAQRQCEKNHKKQEPIPVVMVVGSVSAYGVLLNTRSNYSHRMVSILSREISALKRR
jgi:hypothetical protein